MRALLCTALHFAVVCAAAEADRLGALRARINEFVERGSIAGAVAALARNGKVINIDAFGYQDLERRKQMRPNVIFQLASMTKPVTATAVMILVEQGKVALTDPVERFLPEFRGQMVIDRREGERLILRKPTRPITIRDLMTHTSGMGDYPESLSDLLVKRNRTLAEGVAVFSQQPVEFDPGTNWLYSSPGINTLGRLIEVVSGESYAAFLERHLFGPLGMEDTHFVVPPDKYERLASVYDLRDSRLQKSSVDFRAWAGAKWISASGGLFSTATDLLAFFQMMIDGGSHRGHTILSRATVKLMISNHTGNLAQPAAAHSHGLGWSLFPTGTPPSFGHAGRYGTFGWADPARGSIGLFLIQRNAGENPTERTEFFQMATAALED